ncbi:MAG: 8-amino-7-oxononanoate synthase [Thermodesulfovibrionales bacterium]|nr:8-amino-7-oxononanoate synthase [Thermodesulfovibrionales bacterium]
MFDNELEDLHKRNLIRRVHDRGSAQGARITISGRECVNFGSNDYLGLANHPSLRTAASEAAERWGSGAGASRLLGGGCTLHRELEGNIASFKGTPQALLFGSGYAANTGAIPALAGRGDAIFSDGMNHASIIDGCRLSRAEVHVYRHRDMGHLEELLKKSDKKRKIIVTDTVFSMGGDIAPLNELSLLADKHSALLYTDDAHGTGVLGGGRGALAHAGLAHKANIIQMGTLSKAAGSMGGFIAADEDVIQWILNTARTFIFSTAMPPSAAAASITALELMQSEPGLLKKLWDNRALLINELSAHGIGAGGSETPIIPISARSAGHALEIGDELLQRGFYAPAIRPPTVPEPMVRITVTAGHTPEDIHALADALADLI